MVKSALGKAAWVGRTASMAFGLALVMALLFGATSVGLAASGQPFLLGKAKNAATRVTGLVGNVAGGPALKVTNPSGGPAVGLQANAGQAPLTVNPESGTATNLSADELDGMDSSELQRANAAAGGDLTGSYPNPEVDQDAVTADELADDSVDKDAMRDGAVGSAEVSDAQLTAGDVASFHGRKDLTIGANGGGLFMLPQNCTDTLLDLGSGVDVSNDVLIVTPAEMDPRMQVSTSHSSSPNSFDVSFCNSTDKALRVPLNYDYVVINRP